MIQVTFSNKARLQQTLRSFQSKVKKEALGEDKKTSQGKRLGNEPEKEFERLRIADEEEILFSTPSQVTTDQGRDRFEVDEETTTAALTTPATTTTTTTTTTITTTTTTTATTTATTEPKTSSSLPSKQIAASSFVRFPQEEDNEGRHSIAFGPQLPPSQDDPQVAGGPARSQQVQAQLGPESGTISFQPRKPDPILQVIYLCYLLAHQYSREYWTN